MSELRKTCIEQKREADAYKPEHFELYELVPKYFFQEHQDDPNIWGIFDSRALWTLDRLREIYGKCYVNNWFWGGKNQYSGWRPFDCKTGADLSQHKFGRAFDVKFANILAEDVRQNIRQHSMDYAYQYITCIERDVAWFHFDCRNWIEGILEVAPT